MVYAHGEIVPCLVIHVECCYQKVANIKKTVVRANGGMGNEVVIGVENPGFKITGKSIAYSGA